ncbi:hypothetical protein HAX54_004900 [Datura stramonium]|uniref:Protein kinase domain-containing protein n=1 Tax=Datura stramonium TaxID=4076 RepID=A0ABS8WV69_DATST|nr:hypothetical protein [Datura stramonium]
MELQLTSFSDTATSTSDVHKAWHIFGSSTLSTGRPKLSHRISSKCTLFSASPQFIEFLCSIPNSPLHLTSNCFVTFSSIGFVTTVKFFANADAFPDFVPQLEFRELRPRGQGEFEERSQVMMPLPSVAWRIFGQNQLEQKLLPNFESYIVEEEVQVVMGRCTGQGEKSDGTWSRCSFTLLSKVKGRIFVVQFEELVNSFALSCAENLFHYQRNDEMEHLCSFQRPHSNANRQHVHNELKMLERFGSISMAMHVRALACLHKQVLFRSVHQGTKLDIWSAGVTLLYFIIGEHHFAGDPDQNIKEIVKLKGNEDLWEVAKLHNRVFISAVADVISVACKTTRLVFKKHAFEEACYCQGASGIHTYHCALVASAAGATFTFFGILVASSRHWPATGRVGGFRQAPCAGVLYLRAFFSSGISISSGCTLLPPYLVVPYSALFKFELYFWAHGVCDYIRHPEIIEKAHLGDMDYVKHALTLFTDFAAVFVRILIIMDKKLVPDFFYVHSPPVPQIISRKDRYYRSAQTGHDPCRRKAQEGGMIFFFSLTVNPILRNRRRKLVEQFFSYSLTGAGMKERRIRSYRLQLQQRLQQIFRGEDSAFSNSNYISVENYQKAEERKAAVRKIPEQMILSETSMETACKPGISSTEQQAEEVMKMQLKGDERRKDELMEAMQRQALLEMSQA